MAGAVPRPGVVDHLAAAAPAAVAAPAVRDAHYNVPVTLFGISLTLQVRGNLGANHLLSEAGAPHAESDARQRSLALETAVLSALEHDPEIRRAAQTIRDSRPGCTDDWMMGRLLLCLRFGPSSVTLREPPSVLPNAATWPEHRWYPRDDLHLFQEGDLRHTELGPNDALLAAFRSFTKHHQAALGRPNVRPDEAPRHIWHQTQQALSQPQPSRWKLPRNQLGHPPTGPSTREVLRRIFGDAPARAAREEPHVDLEPEDDNVELIPADDR